MNNDFIDQANESYEMIDVLKEVIQKSMEKTHVATLGFVSELDTNGKFKIARVKPFPLNEGQKEYTIEAYYSSDDELNKDDIVCVLFMDKNFKQNLNFDSPKVDATKELHSISYGVIIKKLN